MSVLLRRPATVPALFSRGLDDEPPSSAAAARWRRVLPRVPALNVPVGAAAASALGLAALVDLAGIADAFWVKATSRIAAWVLSG